MSGNETEEKNLDTTEERDKNLDFFVEARNGFKRNYIYDYGESKTCDHTEMKSIARGGIGYRCTKCNYAFHIVAAYQQPLHNEIIQSMFNVLGFAKEFGTDSLQEVLRRPIGQNDGSSQKPVLPEGMSFEEAVALLEQVDVTTEDGGAEQLEALLETAWVGPKEKAAYLENQQRLEEKKSLQLKEGDGEQEDGADVPPVPTTEVEGS